MTKQQCQSEAAGYAADADYFTKKGDEQMAAWCRRVAEMWTRIAADREEGE